MPVSVAEPGPFPAVLPRDPPVPPGGTPDIPFLRHPRAACGPPESRARTPARKRMASTDRIVPSVRAFGPQATRGLDACAEYSPAVSSSGRASDAWSLRNTIWAAMNFPRSSRNFRLPVELARSTHAQPTCSDLNPQWSAGRVRPAGVWARITGRIVVALKTVMSASSPPAGRRGLPAAKPGGDRLELLLGVESLTHLHSRLIFLSFIP